MNRLDSNFTDADDRPAGGISTGVGYTIAWQNGPCPIMKDGSQPDRNGAFLIEVLESCEARLKHFQEGDFACAENAAALDYLEDVIGQLKTRRDRRRDAGTLGTHDPD